MESMAVANANLAHGRTAGRGGGETLEERMQFYAEGASRVYQGALCSREFIAVFPDHVADSPEAHSVADGTDTQSTKHDASASKAAQQTS